MRVHRHDVVVVGARAAGAATAMLLGRLGHDVVLLDRAVFPSDTISTHQLARPAIVQLHRWRLLTSVLASGAPPIRQVTFTAQGESHTRPVKSKAGLDLLLAPRRYILDTIMAAAAAEAGVTVRFGTAVAGVRLDAGARATGVYGHVDGPAGPEPFELAARFVVGADGLGSRVARSVGARVLEDRGDGGAVQYAYYANVPWRGIELILSDRALTGVFPTHHGLACVWVGTPTADARAIRRAAGSREAAFVLLLERTAPELAARLRAGLRTSPVVGMLRSPNRIRAASGPGWALVGDAGYHRDPVTGHGISDAYRDAELLAVALHEALTGAVAPDVALARYQCERDRALRAVFELTCALAAYPPVPDFIALQKSLSRALDLEASEIAARPIGEEPVGAEKEMPNDQHDRRVGAQWSRHRHPVRHA